MVVEIDEKRIQEMVARGMPQQMGDVSASGLGREESSEKMDIIDSSNPRQRVAKQAVGVYRDSYLQSVEMSDRQVVYIDEDLRESLVDILHVTTKRKINLGSYVTNIIRGHLEENKDVINAMYNKRLKNPL